MTGSLAPMDAAASDRPVRIIAFGDSLTAGYMLPESAAFPRQLQVALEGKGYKVEITNAGVSGDTTSGGLERLAWTLDGGTDAVILELGANDALRGIDPKIASANLDSMIGTIKATGADVLLVGMKAPRNWGDDYVAAYDPIFASLAAKHAVPLYPFFLDGLTAGSNLVMADGLHPTEKGVGEIVKRILPEAEALVQRVHSRRTSATK
ncbi:MAG: arylesterase [Hyphomicrobium sp.]